MGKLLKVCGLTLLAFIFTCGIAFVVISYLPIDSIKVFFDSFDPDGNFNAFSMKHVIKLRIAGILTSIVIGFVYIVRRKLLQYISNIFGLIFYFIKDFKDSIKREDKIHIYTFILIMLLAIAVRIYYLFQPLMADESSVFTLYVYDVNNGVQGILSPLARYENTGNHIFHTFLVYLTYKLLGSEQHMWIIRLPALLAGILLVPASYMVTRIFSNKNSALLASGIVASSSPLIFYSANARGYTLLCLIFLLILALGAYIKDKTDLAGWHLFAILSAVGFYTIPLMLYPYGIVITWIILSLLFKDANYKRNHLLLLRNLAISIVITIILTFLFYSPVILVGTGFDRMLTLGRGYFGVPLEIIPERINYIFSATFWESWNGGIPVIIQYFFIVGFICSLVFHKRLSPHRVPVVFSVPICLVTFTSLQGEICSYSRCWLFLLPLYIGLASAGIIYLIKPIEPIFSKQKSALFAVLAITISFILVGNTVRSEPNMDDIRVRKIDNVDSSGEYIEFRYMQVSMLEHIGHSASKILILFPSISKNEFWNARFQYYFDQGKFIRDAQYLVTDLNLYLSEDSRRCHKLFVLSDETIPDMEVLLGKKGLSVSDYSVPELIHRYKYANLYRMNRIEDCIVKPYQWGAVIQFGSGGNAKPYQNKGWSFPEDGFTWAEGKSSSLVIPIETMPAEPITLKTTFTAFVSPGKVDKQTVDILINGRKADTWLITKQDFQEKTLLISKDFLSTANNIEITFNTPDAASPALVGLSNDTRMLSIAIRTLKLIK